MTRLPVKKSVAEFLRAELVGRQARNPAYSLRAYARDLEVPPSTLSRILSGERIPSPKMAMQLLHLLQFDVETAEEFRNVVFGLNTAPKKRARPASIPQKLLTAEEFAKISSWHAMTVLELLSIPGIETTPRWLSEALKITESQTQEILANLLALGYVREEEGRYFSTGSDVFYKSKVDNDPLVTRHVDEIVAHLANRSRQRAEGKLIADGLPPPHYVAEAIAVHASDVPRLKSLLKPFSDRVRREASGKKRPDSLYQLLVCLFPVYRTPNRQ